MAQRKRRTMLKVKHTTLRDEQRKDAYSGERSPYWDSIRPDQGETAAANPDIVDESDGMYYVTPDDYRETKVEAVNDAWFRLTPLQRQALLLCGTRGLSLAEAAIVMQCSYQMISQHLEGARRKIKRTYKRKLEQENKF